MKTPFLLVQFIGWAILTAMSLIILLSFFINMINPAYGVAPSEIIDLKDMVLLLMLYFIWTNQLLKEIKE